VILVDANLLVYAVAPDVPQHERSRVWLEPRLGAAERVGLPWPSLLAFLRIVTHPRILERPASMETAWAIVREWLALPAVWVPEPTVRHAEVLGGVMPAVTKPNLVAEAQLAALAIEHGLLLCSHGRGFAAFDGLRWLDPLRG